MGCSVVESCDAFYTQNFIHHKMVAQKVREVEVQQQNLTNKILTLILRPCLPSQTSMKVKCLIVYTALYSRIMHLRKNVAVNSHSMSFKVMHLWITEKLTRESVSLYKNVGLSLKFPKK